VSTCPKSGVGQPDRTPPIGSTNGSACPRPMNLLRLFRYGLGVSTLRIFFLLVILDRFVHIFAESGIRTHPTPNDERNVVSRECVFCCHIATGPVRVSETLISESEHFVAWASLGAMIEGWLIIVPKDHYLSLATLPCSLQGEFEDFRGSLERSLRVTYGSAAAFEHGPSAVKTSAGCGIDHAHLHMVPTTYDLLSRAKALMPGDAILEPASSVWDAEPAVKAGKCYIYIQQNDGSQWILSAINIPSQLLRRVISTQLGRPDLYDWRENPEHGIVEATIGRLQGLSMTSS
jgi:ATP adenylyltransferase